MPEDIFDLSAEEYPWAVAHVRSRQEKAAARFLGERGLPFYLPTVEKRIRRGGRSRASFLPLFRGYVFFRASAGFHEMIWRSHVVANLLEVGDQAGFSRELEQIRRLQLAGASFEVDPHLALGDPVEIREGVFRGYEGRVVRDKGHDRLIVQISFLRQQVTAEFDREILRRPR